MNIGRRALFNSLRMNWLSDKSVKVQPWQVEDYRSLSIDEIYKRLRSFDLDFDRLSFLAMAEDVDNPEDFTDGIIADSNLLPDEEYQVYLLIFELWRRLINEKPCLSIFCDELDYQIFSYDNGYVDDEKIQDVIANLEVILDENTDQGVDPLVAFETISSACANDIETFLYDFILQQIDNDHIAYAQDLLDGFEPYLKDASWFEFLRARILFFSDAESANNIIKKLIKYIKKEKDIDLSLEILSFLSKGGHPQIFVQFVKETIPLLETEEDFQELLAICADYYHFLDQEDEEKVILSILKKRPQNMLEKAININDENIKQFLKMLK